VSAVFEAYLSGGARAFTAGRDRVARVWEVTDGLKLLHELRQEEAVTAAAGSPDGRTLATGTESGRVRLWDVETGLLLSPPIALAHGKEHKTITALAFSPDGAWIAAGTDAEPGSSSTVSVLPLRAEARPVPTLRRFARASGCLEIKADGQPVPLTGKACGSARRDWAAGGAD